MTQMKDIWVNYIGTHIGNTTIKYNPPCTKMNFLARQEETGKCYDGTLCVSFRWNVEEYLEVINSPAFGVETLWIQIVTGWLFFHC